MVRYIAALPKSPNCCFRPEPGGLPLPFFRKTEGTSPPVIGETPLPDCAADNDVGEIIPEFAEPSGAYFLGLPRFLLAGSIELGTVVTDGSTEATRGTPMPAAGT